jgi:DNA-binding NtrC family response regulator
MRALVGPAAAQARVLVVDEDPSFHEALADLLSLEGYDVDVVESGDAALALLDRMPALEVVLLDLRPSARKARATLHARRPGVAVVIVGGFGDGDDGDPDDLAAADDHEARRPGRPIDLDLLLAALDRHVARARS